MDAGARSASSVSSPGICSRRAPLTPAEFDRGEPGDTWAGTSPMSASRSASCGQQNLLTNREQPNSVSISI